MRFRYVAYTSDLAIIKGYVEAKDEALAKADLLNAGSKPLEIRPAWRLPDVEDMLPSLFHVTTAELIRFCKQTASILQSGGNLLRAIEMVASETRNRVMRRTAKEILEAIDTGESFSGALAQHPTVFNPLFVSVVEVGEHTGGLAPSLEHIAEILRTEYEAKQRAIKAMMYPLAIMGLSMVTLAILLTVAMPPLLKVFERMDTEVPAATRLALASMTAIREHYLAFIIVMVVLVAGVKFARRYDRINFELDATRLKLPLIGTLTLSAEIARFSRIMTMLLSAGVPLSFALQQGMNGCSNQVLRKAFRDADECLMGGQSLIEGLKAHPILPRLFLQFVMIGEESNTLDKTMHEAADTYQTQQEALMNTVMGLMEPASTVVVAGIVGFIAFSMFVPIYSAMSALG